MDREIIPSGTEIDRSQAIGTQLYAILRRAIVTCRLRPGDMIPEAMVTERLGVSRTPLREAFRQLADDGLVSIRPQAGTFVSVLDRAAWEEGRLIRRALECEAIRRAATRMTASTLDRLEGILTLQARAEQRGHHDQLFTLDDEFHACIVRSSGLPRLWRVIDSAKAELDRTRYLAIPFMGRGSLAVAEHRAILAALTERNGARAALLLKRHLDLSDLAIRQLFAAGEGVQAAAESTDGE
jgi:DNA-binding GntR family transcriptional regulator